MEDKPKLRTLYPEIEPFDSGFLDVPSKNPELKHKLYYEQAGKKDGKPALVLHGGPGGGCAPFYRQYFDPEVYRVILFDQRGAGKSVPMGCLEENTTWDLVEDIERLRKHFNVDRWVVFGGSWGSTLALAYAEAYPERVKALVLRGIFTLRRKELEWFYQDGASFLFPDYWEEYLSPIPEVERADLMSAYHRRLTGNDEVAKQKCAKAWTKWEMATSRLYVDPENVKKAESDEFAATFARIECHYFVNGGFFNYETQLIDESTKLKEIPGVIVQGRYDVVCPPISAWDLHKKWPTSKLIMVADAGHSMKEPGILSALVQACDDFRSL